MYDGQCRSCGNKKFRECSFEGLTKRETIEAGTYLNDERYYSLVGIVCNRCGLAAEIINRYD